MEIQLPEISGQNITFSSVFKNQFNSWHLKDQITLTPEQIDQIHLTKVEKVKIYREQPVQAHYLLKVTETKSLNISEDHLYAISNQNLRIFFQKLILYKLKSLGLQPEEDYAFGTQIEGDCYKKSEFLHKWEERHLKITTQNGLSSMKQEKQTLHIKDTSQIWTRFQVLENNYYFVIKVKYWLTKQEFAVPIKQAGKWVRAFFSLFYA